MKKNTILLFVIILTLFVISSCTKKAEEVPITVDVSPEELVMQLENSVEKYIQAYEQYRETEDAAQEDSLLIEMIGYGGKINEAHDRILELMELDVFTEEQITKIETLWDSYTEL